jgi:16S rRNA (uracil1498-N3)-methyltransferase
MNLILFDAAELGRPLPRTDPRARHLLGVLRRQVGDAFDAGLVNGPRGRATLTALTADALTLTFTATTPPPTPEPGTLLVGLPRPQTARDILRDATTLGTGALHFVHTEKSDPNYAASTLWSQGEWRRQVLAGAEQAFSTQVPQVTAGRTLAETLAALPPGGLRLALDNYEGTRRFGEIAPASADAWTLALGPERGWGPRDRALLSAAGFQLCHLGSRVLRLETACTAALTLLHSRLGRM